MTTSNAPTSIRSTDALEREARQQAIEDRGTEIEFEEAEAWITTLSHSLGPFYQEVRAVQEAITRFQHNINYDRIEEQRRLGQLDDVGYALINQLSITIYKTEEMWHWIKRSKWLRRKRD
jgi:hypothetical protein